MGLICSLTAYAQYPFYSDLTGMSGANVLIFHFYSDLTDMHGVNMLINSSSEKRKGCSRLLVKVNWNTLLKQINLLWSVNKVHHNIVCEYADLYTPQR